MAVKRVSIEKKECSPKRYNYWIFYKYENISFGDETSYPITMPSF